MATLQILSLVNSNSPFIFFLFHIKILKAASNNKHSSRGRDIQRNKSKYVIKLQMGRGTFFDKGTTFQLIYLVLVNKLPQTGWAKQQTFTFLKEFWGLEKLLSHYLDLILNEGPLYGLQIVNTSLCVHVTFSCSEIGKEVGVGKGRGKGGRVSLSFVQAC